MGRKRPYEVTVPKRISFWKAESEREIWRVKTRYGGGGHLSNAQIAELLAAEADKASYPVQRALRKAGRSAFLWPMEAAELARQKRSLTELRGIGPYLEKVIKNWLEKPPQIPASEEIR